MKQYGAGAFVAGSQTEKQGPFIPGTWLNNWLENLSEAPENGACDDKLALQLEAIWASILQSKACYFDGIKRNLSQAVKRLCLYITKTVGTAVKRTKSVFARIKLSFERAILLPRDLTATA